ncbi:MAG: hypothetical protein KKB24_00510 [Candidatus Altiarchaeota archaeon]|nr:hypothetical protein [Candidatus Altiarchaeota archaeon]
MKRMDKKGQGAMEYLMTYGWAILVVMIVGVVLWQLGIFGGGPGAVNTASGFGKVKPMEPSIKFTGSTLSFSIMNGVGQAITNVTIEPDTCTADASFTNVVTSKFGAGEVQQVDLISCGTKTSGQSFSDTLTIRYVVTVAGSDVVHTEVGTIRGVAE